MLFLLLLNCLPWMGGTELRLSLQNIQQPVGSVYIAVYDNAADFMNTEKVRAKKIVPAGAAGTISLSFPGLTGGHYAVTCFHDLNENGRLDTNMFGIPVEPFGFSNNIRPKIGAPSWDEVRFWLPETGATQEIRLDKW